MTSGDGGKKPRITAKKNGPYIVNDVEDLKNSQGEALPTQPEMALCRCGGSEDKPFCDGTHFLVGFDGQCQNNGEKNRVKDYEGRDITVHDNRWACSHIGYCSRGLPAVFRPKEKPWVRPDEAPADEVEATVGLCPSGALSHTRDGVLHRDLDREPGIRVDHNGAYQVVGGPEFEDKQGGAKPVSPEHYSLCRCGASENKPFCDGTHRFCGFDDPKN